MAKMDVGMQMFDFTYDTAWEKNQDFYATARGRKTVLRFLRYYGCPVCQLELAELIENYDRFEALEVNLFVVMQSAGTVVASALEKEQIPFPLICDPEQKLYHALEIGNVRKFLYPTRRLFQQCLKVLKKGIRHGAYEGNEKQAPAMFILDEDMKVIFAQYGKNYVDIPSIDATIDWLKR